MAQFACSENGHAIGLDAIPCLSFNDFRDFIITACKNGHHLSALFATTENSDDARLWAVISDAPQLNILSTKIGVSFPSLTLDIPQAHLFEREIAEQFGITPQGHPWLKPVRFHQSYQPNRDAWQRNPQESIKPAVMDFYQIAGEEVHEVAVGPVHAGIIEPGHFRFQCHGEKVIHLEISLGYQHRGIERCLINGPHIKTLALMETLAGDATIGHALAYCQAVESLAGIEVSAAAHILRAVALELERLANHVGDLGALANDVGYLPTSSYCGRLRGGLLNLTALMCGSRFGRGLLIPGGVRVNVDESRAKLMQDRLSKTMDDIENAVSLLWNTSSVLARFENTGIISRESCEALGLVGPAARASGIAKDVRTDFPLGLFGDSKIPLAIWPSGDVYARAYVRWLEISHSANFILEQLALLPEKSTNKAVGDLRKNQLVVSLVEGWRGQICHVAITNSQGRFAGYKVIDPSFFNWQGLALALRGQEISDFPLCNKSFNLSYCGHDL